MTSAFLYLLVDPRDEAVRYVGVTSNPSRRLYQHLRADKETHRDRWIRSLQALGLLPRMDIIFEAKTLEGAYLLERYAIEQLRKWADLTNLTEGGEGSEPGQKRSEEQRLKLVEAWAIRRQKKQKRKAEVLAIADRIREDFLAEQERRFPVLTALRRDLQNIAPKRSPKKVPKRSREFTPVDGQTRSKV